MGKATDKQISFLQKMGIDATTWTFEQASAKISELIANQEKPKERPKFESDKPMAKSFDTSSYYVAYCKDIVVACLSLEVYKNVSIDVLMGNAILAIKKAREAF